MCSDDFVSLNLHRRTKLDFGFSLLLSKRRGICSAALLVSRWKRMRGLDVFLPYVSDVLVA